jgi:uncharacterized membrane protein HdeD (DUF308 family)
MNRMQKIPPALINEEAELSLEVVILLIFGLFMSLFGALLFKIDTGDLPYSPDSTYGLFLVLVSLQTVTLGKTPFGDLHRSWFLVVTGIGAAIVGMTACFIPGLLLVPVRFLVGFLLAAGGAWLLLMLLTSREKAQAWMKSPGILRHLTLAAGLVYWLSILSGLVTLFPGITTDPQTAVLLIAYGVSFFYLAGCIRVVRRLYPSEKRAKGSPGPGSHEHAGSKPVFVLFRESSLSLSTAILVLLAALLSLLGMLLFPVAIGLLPFSADGQLGLLLVLTAVQMTAMGDTPAGQCKRSVWLALLGMAFALLGIFSCIVPGILTGILQKLVGILNFGGGLILLARRIRPMMRQGSQPESRVAPLPSLVKELSVTQTLLNLVVIGFGLSMLLPGLVPVEATAGMLVINGILLFRLSHILLKLDDISRTHRADL